MPKKVYRLYRKKLSKFGKVFYKAGYYTVMHDGIEHAGYIAFITLLALFPFLVFLVAIASSIGREEYGFKFITDFMNFLPTDVVNTIKPRIDELLSGPPQGLLTLAIIGTIWTSSSGVEGLRTILNRAYRVNNPPNYIFRKLMSMLQIILLSFTVILAMFFITLSPNFIDYLQVKFSLRFEVIDYINRIRFMISPMILFLCISLSYYILPNIKQSFIRVVPGAVIVFFLWMCSAVIFSTYITYYQQVSIVYGSLASIILTLLFFYILAIIYIYGAEFNYFFERAIGHKIIQKE